MSAETDSVEAAMHVAGRLAPFSDGELMAELNRRFPVMVVLLQSAADESGIARRIWAYGGSVQICFVMAYRFVHDVLGRLV